MTGAMTDRPMEASAVMLCAADEDGEELQAEASAKGGEPPRAIALSAHTGPRDVERARAAGFQQHLAKPVDAGHLVATIQDVLGRAPRVPAAAPT